MDLASFELMIERKCFTNRKTDCAAVCRLYAATLDALIHERTRLLNFMYLRWGDTEIAQLVTVLPRREARGDRFIREARGPPCPPQPVPQSS